MGQRIIPIVSENKEQHLNKLKSYLLQYGHPEEVLDYAMTTLSHHHAKVKMNAPTILLLFRLTILRLSLIKILLILFYMIFTIIH